ncbi:MAG: helix-turn-helix domain-containing protein [Paracoccaceae bacterium]|jgi:transcriptional regulator GlxA family with amidase domain|nr:helix-turn-helix domain-containing protein [Paracoccaceae bacterium]MDP7186980.1 helix-turn-helix domain-containing protein [Paracoccaceae bacterium]
MTRAAQFHEIGILLYPGARPAAVHGLMEQFEVGNFVLGERSGPDARPISLSQWEVAADGGHIGCTSETMPASGLPDLLIIPPNRHGDAPVAQEGVIAPWLIDLHRRGVTLAAACAGMFLLARTGLLDGRRVAAHNCYGDALAAGFPAIRVDSDRVVVDEGDILTSGGIMSWPDLGLRILERHAGTGVMAETARLMMLDPPGREQRFYRTFTPSMSHGDDAILRVQTWLAGLREVTVSGATMAERAGMERRTFLRRFKKATGYKPTEYCQQLRVEQARDLLERTLRPVEQISWQFGYSDPNAFRGVFRRVIGLTPAAYRTRFGVARGQDERARTSVDTAAIEQDVRSATE